MQLVRRYVSLKKPLMRLHTTSCQKKQASYVNSWSRKHSDHRRIDRNWSWRGRSEARRAENRGRRPRAGVACLAWPLPTGLVVWGSDVSSPNDVRGANAFGHEKALKMFYCTNFHPQLTLGGAGCGRPLQPAFRAFHNRTPSILRLEV